MHSFKNERGGIDSRKTWQKNIGKAHGEAPVTGWELDFTVIWPIVAISVDAAVVVVALVLLELAVVGVIFHVVVCRIK